MKRVYEINTISAKSSETPKMISGAGTLFCLAALRMTRSASSTRPFCRSQRGDSGINLNREMKVKKSISLSNETYRYSILYSTLKGKFLPSIEN